MQLLLETGLTAAQLFDALGLEIDLTDGGVVVAIVTVQRHQRRLGAQQSTAFRRASALPSALLPGSDLKIKYAFEPHATSDMRQRMKENTSHRLVGSIFKAPKPKQITAGHTTLKCSSNVKLIR